MDNQKENQVCIVLGMHRSGTSLLAGLLHKSGICMGRQSDFYPPPSTENEKGFYENYRIRRCNDWILRTHHYNATDWRPNIHDFDQIFFHRSTKGKILDECVTGRTLCRLWRSRLVKFYSSRYYKWGWKDPRQMLTMNSWIETLKTHNLLAQTKIIFVFRHPASVARSMLKRENIRTEIHGQCLWHFYNQKAVQDLGHFPEIPILYLPFDDLIAESTACSERIGDFLHTEISKNTYHEFFDPRLVHHKDNNLSLIGDEVESLWLHLNAKANEATP